MKLGEAVDRPVAPFGVRMRPVPESVVGGLEPKVRRQIDNPLTRAQRLLDQGRSLAMRRRAKEHLTPGDDGVRVLKNEFADAHELRPAGAHRLPQELTARNA